MENMFNFATNSASNKFYIRYQISGKIYSFSRSTDKTLTVKLGREFFDMNVRPYVKKSVEKHRVDYLI